MKETVNPASRPCREEILGAIAAAPRAPGVYLFRDAAGKPVYIGKAKDLAGRLASYKAKDVPPKTRVMLSRAARLETILAPDETEALILESALIKRHRPRYNVLLKDDKRYPYAIRTKGPFPQFFLTRRPDPRRGRIYGPFPDALSLRQALEVVSRLYKIRRCPGPLPKRDRPCLDAEIGRCDAPCVGWISEAKYAGYVARAARIFEGRTEEAEEILRGEMKAAAAALDFEAAASRRDEVAALATLSERTLGRVGHARRDFDALCVAGDEARTVALLFEIRDGNLAGRHRYRMTGGEDLAPAERIAEALKRHYADFSPPPRILLVQRPAEDLSAFLARAAGGARVRIETPRRGLGARVLAMLRENAEEYLRLLALEEAASAESEGPKELARILGLEVVPDMIEGYDIATLSGGETVGARVRFVGVKPEKEGYRRYRIRTTEIALGRPDDYAALREVFARRARAAREGEETEPNRRASDDMPDLILVDGGRGQLAAAILGLGGAAGETRILALAKREEEIWLHGRKTPIRLGRRSPALRLLQRIRDEAHRFAGDYHRLRRSKELFAGTGGGRRGAPARH